MIRGTGRSYTFSTNTCAAILMLPYQAISAFGCAIVGNGKRRVGQFRSHLPGRKYQLVHVLCGKCFFNGQVFQAGNLYADKRDSFVMNTDIPGRPG